MNTSEAPKPYIPSESLAQDDYAAEQPQDYSSQEGGVISPEEFGRTTNILKSVGEAALAGSAIVVGAVFMSKLLEKAPVSEIVESPQNYMEYITPMLVSSGVLKSQISEFIKSRRQAGNEAA